MTATWYECAGAMSTAVLAVLTADAVLGTAGTYGVVTRELLPAITDDDPVVHKKLVPYIGVVSIVGNPRQEGASWAVPLVVGIHVAEKETPPSSARARVSAMATLATKLIADMDRTVPSGMINQITFMAWDIGKPRVDKADNTLVRADSTVTFDLWYHD